MLPRQPGMVVHACDPGTQTWASLGYLRRVCLDKGLLLVNLLFPSCLTHLSGEYNTPKGQSCWVKGHMHFKDLNGYHWLPAEEGVYFPS